MGHLRYDIIEKERKRLAMRDDTLQKLLADVQEPNQERGLIPAGKMRRRSSASRPPVEQSPVQNVTYVPRGFWRSLISNGKRALMTGMVSMACLGTIGCFLINPIWGIADRWDRGSDTNPRTDIKYKAIGFRGDSEEQPSEIIVVNNGGKITVLVQPTGDPSKAVQIKGSVTQGGKGNMSPDVSFDDKDKDGRLDIVVTLTPHEVWQTPKTIIILNKEQGLELQK